MGRRRQVLPDFHERRWFRDLEDRLRVVYPGTLLGLRTNRCGRKGSHQQLTVYTPSDEGTDFTYYTITGAGSPFTGKVTIAGNAWTYDNRFEQDGKKTEFAPSTSLRGDEESFKTEFSVEGGPWMTMLKVNHSVRKSTGNSSNIYGVDSLPGSSMNPLVVIPRSAATWGSAVPRRSRIALRHDGLQVVDVDIDKVGRVLLPRCRDLGKSHELLIACMIFMRFPSGFHSDKVVASQDGQPLPGHRNTVRHRQRS